MRTRLAVAGSALSVALATVATPVPASAVVRSTRFAVAGVLASVTSTSANDAWAVGSTSTNILIAHWNGQAWQLVGSRRLPAAYSRLVGVSASSASGAWAVGTFSIGNGPLSERLTGAGWRRVPAPNPRGDTTISGVATVTGRNVWAVGGTSTWTVIMHWNGRSWRRVPSPSPSSSGSYLEAVASVSVRNAWAVGSTGSQALILHWGGIGWRRTPTPRMAGSPVLFGVAATGPGDAWAVGGTTDTGKTLIEHWNGRSWKRLPTPSLGFSTLSGVAATSARNAWAVGIAGTKPLILHWNGRSWKRVPSPCPASYCTLSAVTATSARNAWAVGYAGPRTLILHWNGRRWT